MNKTLMLFLLSNIIVVIQWIIFNVFWTIIITYIVIILFKTELLPELWPPTTTIFGNLISLFNIPSNSLFNSISLKSDILLKLFPKLSKLFVVFENNNFE